MNVDFSRDNAAAVSLFASRFPLEKRRCISKKDAEELEIELPKLLAL